MLVALTHEALKLALHMLRKFNQAFNITQGAAFPSGHATESHLIARLLGIVLPDKHPARPLLLPLAHRIAINREVMGLHYRSDSEAGELLAEMTLKDALSFAGWKAEGESLSFVGRLLLPLGAVEDKDAKVDQEKNLIAQFLTKAKLEWLSAK